MKPSVNLPATKAEGPRHEATDTGSALLQAALTRHNLQRALKRVRANKGAAGVDLDNFWADLTSA